MFKFLNKVLILAFIIRIILAFCYDTGDTGAVNLATTTFLKGHEVYSNSNIYFSPPPFSLHILVLLHLISNNLHIPFTGFWKILANLSDLGIGILIYLISIKFFKRSKETAKLLCVWYLFNPVVLFVSGYHGQQESVWLFFILSTWYILSYSKKSIITTGIAGVLAGFAIGYKLPAAILIIPLFFAVPGLTNQIIFVCVTGLVCAVSFFPEMLNPVSRQGIIKQVFLYSSTLNVWGISLLAAKIPFLSKHFTSIIAAFLKILMAVAMGLNFILSHMKKKNFFEVSLSTILIFLFLTPGFGTQYLLWPVPFLILLTNRYLFLYTLVVTFGFLHFYSLLFPPLDFILKLLQENIYYKIHLFYPYDLLLPIWILIVYMLFQKLPFTDKLVMFDKYFKRSVKNKFVRKYFLYEG